MSLTFKYFKRVAKQNNKTAIEWDLEDSIELMREGT